MLDSAKTKPEADEDFSFYVFCHTAWEERDRNTDKTNKFLYKEVRSNPSLRKLIIEEAMEQIVANSLCAARAHEREKLRAIPLDNDGSAEHAKALVNALSEATKEALLNFPLFGTGKRLRDATREEIAISRQQYEKQGKTALHKARWLGLIEEELSAKQIAGKVLDEYKLAKLYQEAAQ